MAQLISNNKHFDPILLDLIEKGKNGNAISFIEDHIRHQQLDLVDDTGCTLLHHAVKFNNIEIVCFLVNLDCKTDVSNYQGNTPLMLAAVHNHVKLVEILIKGISIDHLRKLFDYVMLKRAEVSPDVFQMILGEFKNTNFDEKAIVQLLLEKQCSLYYFVLLTSNKVIEKMIDDDFSVNDKNPFDGNSPLHVAAAFGNLKIVQLLVEHGADINAVNKKGEIPLNHDQQWSGEDMKILQFLVEKGSLLTLCDTAGRMQTYNIFRYGNGPAIKMLLRSNLDLNVQDSNGDTVIHYAALNERPDTFLHLMKQNFNPNVQNKLGFTPLHIMAYRKDTRAMWLLLAKGADVNIKSYDDTSLLCIVVAKSDGYRSDEECIRELLVEYEADIQYVTKKGITVLYRSENMTDIALPHLALLEAQGTVIIEPLRRIIDSNVTMKRDFNYYRSELEQLKTVKVYESITVFHLLTDSKSKIRSYLHNEALAEKLRDLLDFEHELDIHWLHFDILKKRVIEALNIMDWQEKAAFAFCKVMGNQVKFAGFIIKEVMCYLSLDDMKSLAAIDCSARNTSVIKRPVSAVRNRKCKRQKVFQ